MLTNITNNIQYGHSNTFANLEYDENNLSLIDIDRDYFQFQRHIEKNLNPKVSLRQYQVNALKTFYDYMQDYQYNAPIHRMFHMATGSGKTVIMASLILDLYRRGYRNFIFFVNSNAIIEKTRENFLNKQSSKYLFVKDLSCDWKDLTITEVDEFDNANSNHINIHFTTTHKLHGKLNKSQENMITFEDLKKYRIVMLADEAHHNSADEWEKTILRILNANNKNVLLEFTATLDEEQEKIAEKYKDKIIFKYDLKEYCSDGYSKDIQINNITVYSKLDRILGAILLSQYRLKIAEKNLLSIKPVVLIKSLNISSSMSIKNEFLDFLDNISGNDLRTFKNKMEQDPNEKLFKMIFDYFDKNNIDYHNLALEIKNDFNENKIIDMNNDNDKEKNIVLLNSLEDKNNHIRMVFAVNKLDEGWDVLNLFDIVRVYDRKSNTAKTTNSEVQLIGRGARYYPFEWDGDKELRFKRKFDNKIDNELRCLEELYYHTAETPKFIEKLKKSLDENGLRSGEKVERKLILKEEFQNKEIYKTGKIYLNKKIEVDRTKFSCLSDYGIKIDETFKEDIKTPSSYQASIITQEQQAISQDSNHYEDCVYKLTHSYWGNVVRHALNLNSFYQFNNLKRYFPNLKSISEFITSENFLSSIEIQFTGDKKIINELSPEQKLIYIKKVLESIAEKLKIPDNMSSEFIIHSI